MPPRSISFPNAAETGPAKSGDAACVRGIGVCHHTRCAHREEVVENAPDEARSVTLADEPGLANEEVNAARAAWLVAVGVTNRLVVRSGTRRMMGVVHLQIARVAAAHGEDEALNGGFAQMLDNRAQGAFWVWPPVFNVRLREPAADGAEVGRSHRPKTVSDRRHCRGALRLDHVLLWSASRTTLVLV